MSVRYILHFVLSLQCVNVKEDSLGGIYHG